MSAKQISIIDYYKITFHKVSTWRRLTFCPQEHVFSSQICAFDIFDKSIHYRKKIKLAVIVACTVVILYCYVICNKWSVIEASEI